MGYTHYWRTERELPQTEFDFFVQDCRVILNHIRSQRGEDIQLRDVTLNRDSVIFNSGGIKNYGDEISFHQEGETFHFARLSDHPDFVQGNDRQERVFHFCKTHNLPYDIVVVACLIVAKHWFGDDISISSDGENKDWLSGIELVTDLLNYGSNFSLEEDAN